MKDFSYSLLFRLHKCADQWAFLMFAQVGSNRSLPRGENLTMTPQGSLPPFRYEASENSLFCFFAVFESLVIYTVLLLVADHLHTLLHSAPLRPEPNLRIQPNLVTEDCVRARRWWLQRTSLLFHSELKCVTALANVFFFIVFLTFWFVISISALILTKST